MRGLTIVGLLVLSVLASCGRSSMINETKEVEQGKWAFDQSVSFETEVLDSLTPQNFYILFRHSGDYKYQNLIVIVKTYFPNNTFVSDTIDCPLADPSGRWYGSGLGDLLDNRIMFKRNVQMPFSGDYKFEIQHAMRPDTIDGVFDVGIAIESAVE